MCCPFDSIRYWAEVVARNIETAVAHSAQNLPYLNKSHESSRHISVLQIPYISIYYFGYKDVICAARILLPLVKTNIAIISVMLKKTNKNGKLSRFDNFCAVVRREHDTSTPLYIPLNFHTNKIFTQRLGNDRNFSGFIVYVWETTHGCVFVSSSAISTCVAEWMLVYYKILTFTSSNVVLKVIWKKTLANAFEPYQWSDIFVPIIFMTQVSLFYIKNQLSRMFSGRNRFNLKREKLASNSIRAHIYAS